MTTPRTGVRAVHWHSSPSCARYLEYLECRGDASPDELAKSCHNHIKYSMNLCRLLLAAGVVHVRAWRRNSGGHPSPIYRLGPGESRPIPKPESCADKCRRRRRSMVKLYGKSVTSKILDSKKHGRPTIVIDGKRITAGSHTSHLSGKVVV